MCGIAGIFHRRRTSVVDPHQLQQMAAALAHRGPDGSGVWAAGPVGFAHRRLAIIDLAGGAQPMTAPDTGAVITYNGEIYNYRELRSDLLRLGRTFCGESDTEVILRAYEQWGEASVERLRGMFAFAIWDPRTRSLFAARDRLGIKPFYYRWDGESLAFASELKALTALRSFRQEIDNAAFESYLRLQYVPGPSTMLRGIRQLEAARTLSVSEDAELRTSRYWSPAPRERVADNDLVEFQERLDDAVESHLVSDVPVGAFLSGGLDSSLVVAMMAAKVRQPVKTFSIGFTGSAHLDERPAARCIAARFGTDHHDRLVTDDDAANALPALVGHMDQPLADYASLPTFLMAELAAREVKVVLTGEGADELFGGYRRYRKERLLAPFAAFRRPYQATSLFGVREITRLLGRPPSSPVQVAPSRAIDSLNRVLVRDIEGWLADDLLAKVDQMTMLCSLEARVPYLDHPFVEFALAVPANRKIGILGKHKILMREAAAQLLPSEVAQRPKHGFTPPLERWFAGRLGALAREVLLDSSARLNQRVDQCEVKRLVNRRPGQATGHKIWALLVYELWSRRHAVA
jgi:asparagine synthase (glutamine-hydrolysing)